MRETIEKILPHKTPAKTQARAFAPSNIALCKYWGKRNQEINLPMNSSLSISLADKGADVTISIASDHDSYVINGENLKQNNPHYARLKTYFDLFRSADAPAFYVTLNLNIPLAAGLASSACIYAAIVKALNTLFGWKLEAKALSILARLGSGSASRSIETGFVKWHRGTQDDGMDSFAEKLLVKWPKLCIGLTQLQTQQKKISSRKGMQLTVETSPLYKAWPEQAEKDLLLITQAIHRKDFELLGKTAEKNALAMHATMLCSTPALLYSTAQTTTLMQKIWALRENGLLLYFTQDAGPNLKLLFLENEIDNIKSTFEDLEIIKPFNGYRLSKQ